MDRTKAQMSSSNFILSCYTTINKVVILLEQSNLTHVVKAHCFIAVKVLVIIYADLPRTANTNLLSEKEFDTLFKLFPAIYFNNRALIPEDMIIDHIRKCIRTNSIVSFN